MGLLPWRVGITVNDVSIVQSNLANLETLPDPIWQALALLCWAAMVLLGRVAWRRRRGRETEDLSLIAGFWLALRLVLLIFGWPRSGQTLTIWLSSALDLVGLVLLVWPFLAPPVPAAWADRLACIGLATVLPACGVALWQWVRDALGLPVAQPPSITWVHAALALAALAALNLLRRPTRVWYWALTSVVALIVGVGGALIALAASASLSSLLAAGMAALAAAWLNLLERSPEKEEPSRLWPPSHWLEASTALFAAPDLTQLLEAATAMLAHVVEIGVAGLFLADDEEPLRLRLVARSPPLDEPGMYSSFSPSLIPLLADTLSRRRIAKVARGAEELLEPLERVLGAELAAVLVLPLVDGQEVRGVLVLGRDSTGLDAGQRRLCSSLADQIAVVIGRMRLRFKIVQQARSLAHLARRHQQESDRLLAIVESIADGVIISDADDVVTLANSRACKLLGMERGDVLGRPFGQIVGRAVQAGDVGVMGMATDASPYSLEVVLRIAGRAVQTSMAPIESSSGAQLGVAALMRDVTAQAEAEEERERQLARLHKQKRELAKAAEHMRKLVWAGKMDLALGDTDLRELVGEVVRDVAPLIGGKPVTVVRALEFGLPTIRADKGRVRQVLLNLLTNAIKYTKEGQIAVSASHGKGYVIVSIAHIGARVASRYVEAIYEGLGRTEDPVSRKMDGLRLSLSASRRLIELHGGKIWVRKGRMLIIHFGLPVAGPSVSELGRSA